jgi:multidrug efflux pump subunit AcrA (membrane-fusion protein)
MAAAVGVGLVALTLGVQALPSAVPTIPGATAWTYTVQRGTLVRQIRGPGTLVPEQARLITAVTAGRIEEILLLPGSSVSPGDVIMRLSNPDQDMQLLQAQQQLSQAEATLAQLRSNVRTQELTQAQTVAQVRTLFLEAQRQYETNRRLFETNADLVAQADLDRTHEQLEDLRMRLDLEEQRADVLTASQAEQISAQEVQIERLRAIVEFQQNRLASLDVTVRDAGVLSPLDVPLQEGQWITAGQQLARVVAPGRLKAEVRIAQTQAQEIVVGQRALIDTRTDTIEGQVVRIDPAVRGGTVTIDVMLPETLPASARPDLSVDGNVIIESLSDVVFIGRPSFGQADQRVMMFKLVEGGEYAERVPVEFGAASVGEIEVRSGLDPGDVVILSDMSQWDGFDRVRLR